mmetsp:Transcript_11336/g.18951  ORF Transcript_11336/g.18951 Transcript_11336/m.18951 type:complete len:236 (-) Transcript_11336:197-904(-)
MAARAKEAPHCSPSNPARRRRRKTKWKVQSICPVLKTLGENNEETWEEERISLQESLGCSQPCPPDDAEHHLASAHNFLQVKQHPKEEDNCSKSGADSCDNVELPKQRWWRSRPRLFAEYEISPPVPIRTIEAAAVESTRSDSLEGEIVSQYHIVRERVSVALEHSSKILKRHQQRKFCLLKLVDNLRRTSHQAVVESVDSDDHWKPLSQLPGAAHPKPGRQRQPGFSSNYYNNN